MSLNDKFPDSDVIRSPAPEVPEIWTSLVSLPRSEALSSIVDELGLGRNSRMRDAVHSASDLAVLAPLEPDDRQLQRMWTLALEYDHEYAMLFDCPEEQMLWSSLPLPDPYMRVARRLGSLRFDQSSGHLVWPAGVEPKSDKIRLACSDLDNIVTLLPFFNHLTGDYDCWVGDDFDEVVTFDHETCAYRTYSTGGFAKWLERRFRSNCDSRL